MAKKKYQYTPELKEKTLEYYSQFRIFPLRLTNEQLKQLTDMAKKKEVSKHQYIIEKVFGDSKTET